MISSRFGWDQKSNISIISSIVFFIVYLIILIVVLFVLLKNIWFAVYIENDDNGNGIFNTITTTNNNGNYNNNKNNNNNQIKYGQINPASLSNYLQNKNIEIFPITFAGKSLDKNVIFTDPFLYFALINSTFFKNYNLLNGNNSFSLEKPSSSSFNKEIILPQPPKKMTAFTIPYRSLVFNKNYKLTEKEIVSYNTENNNKNDTTTTINNNNNNENNKNDTTTTTINNNENNNPYVATMNCTRRPPVTSVVLYQYPNNTQDDTTEALMCDCSDHYHLLEESKIFLLSNNNHPNFPNNDEIKIDSGPTAKMIFPFPGMTPITSSPATTLTSSGLYEPIIGSTLINRPGTLLLDINGPCTGLPDGLYDIIEVSNSFSINQNGNTNINEFDQKISRKDLNLFLNTHPNKYHELWLSNQHVKGDGITRPNQVICTSGIISRLD
uniref:Wsv325-like protein n=1 Tax=Metapenaeus joyneri majanivirus TaxID=2984280 RepID=A0A9C7F702_9VIRU|nr:MAG: wsv325-like protein [Metapenaeus joyneri majanivirus]